MTLILTMTAVLIAVILVNGLGYFWPSDLVRLTFKDAPATPPILGEMKARETAWEYRLPQVEDRAVVGKRLLVLARDVDQHDGGLPFENRPVADDELPHDRLEGRHETPFQLHGEAVPDQGVQRGSGRTTLKPPAG